MSLITCCPACGTMFKVVPDQLRISEGWVRCGHCSNVFDAAAHMADPLGPPLPVLREEIAPSPAEGRGGAAPVAGREAAQPWATAQPPLPTPPRQPGAAPSFHAPPEPVPPPFAEPVPPRDTARRWGDREPPADARGLAPAGASPGDTAYDDLEPYADAISREREAVAGATSAPRVESTPAIAPTAARRAPVDDAPSSLPYSEAPEHDVSFVRQGRRRAFWRRPVVRGMLAVLALALLALLAAQFAVQERDRLAASEPALRPWLERLCVPLGCRVGPPRQIEAIVIDSSSFSKARGDSYRLSVTLKNNSAAAVAVPSLELTLTDTQDQPVLRRVLSPAELGATTPMLAAGGDWSTTVGLAVTNGSTRVAGYRLLAFYP